MHGGTCTVVRKDEILIVKWMEINVFLDGFMLLSYSSMVSQFPVFLLKLSASRRGEVSDIGALRLTLSKRINKKFKTKKQTILKTVETKVMHVLILKRNYAV
jgi:hypothetical protein